MAKHHKYGGSSCIRWAICTISSKLIEQDVLAGKISKGGSSVYADQGSVAHDLGETCIAKGYNPNDFYNQNYSMKIDGRKVSFVIDEDFIDAVKIYVDHINYKKERAQWWRLEKRVHIRKELDGADCGGSADFAGVVGSVLHIDDYKHGKGIGVEIGGNFQTRLYAICILIWLTRHKPKLAKKIKHIQMTIIQPRKSHKDGAIRVEKITLKELLAWFEDVIKPAIEANENGTGVLSANTKTCEWCPRKAYCTEHAKLSAKNAEQEFSEFIKEEALELEDINSLTNEQMINILSHSKDLIKWIGKIEEHLTSTAEKGETVEGRKLVRNFGNRVYKEGMSERRILRKLKRLKLNKEIYYDPAKLKTPAQLEKTLAHTLDNKADAKAIVTTLTEKPFKGLLLVDNSDGRDEVAPNAETEFSAHAEKPKKRKIRKIRKRKNRK